eukprot:TRINITY_DN2554_c0_g1_i3.p1 TRINITY_DN2554_c0_g1~~TRINITY_DN2554_c0_g1_i3.p1  ORF type:complete len:1538 (+),score=305.96 TRINITY_DN2554_c0_g1_i3:91-4704(+)
MGIPKFFRWLSERYPNISQEISKSKAPEYDNLYLDMNGIIHNCSHPQDLPEGTHLTEAEMFQSIFAYIDGLFDAIKPRKVFFMAIDGSAPRAKINQQRSRRFRSAQETEQKIKDAGGSVQEDAFDSNCITPGTEFMHKLTIQIENYVQQRIRENPLWRVPKIIFSSHQVPGEGEHKIMEFIRAERVSQGYDPNTRHCLYGLDADLIMLGLVSHEAFFSLLREEVNFKQPRKGSKFSNQTTPQKPHKTFFQLLHISLLRDYLTLDVCYRIKEFDYKFDRVIDDLVLACMLVGNDFLPNLPGFDIADNTMDVIFAQYPLFLSTHKRYIHAAGQIDFGLLALLFQMLSTVENERYGSESSESLDDESPRKKFGSKGKKHPGMSEFFSDGHHGSQSYLDYADKKGADSDDSDSYKKAYYEEKFHASGYGNPDFVTELCKHYVTGLVWVTNYYFQGCVSWDWYYPYHYAPFITDLAQLGLFDVTFPHGSPWLPYQQLLAVLPPFSAKLLPKPYQRLMLDKESPIIDYYPKTFDIDMNAKKNSWEGVVLIPFIDAKRLMDAYNRVSLDVLSEEENSRNRFCHAKLFQYDSQKSGSNSVDYRFELPPDYVHQPLITIESRNTALDHVFPSLKTKACKAFQKSGVGLFGRKSKRVSIYLEIFDEEWKPEEVLGAQVFAGWPHMIPGLVVEYQSQFRHLKYNEATQRITTTPTNIGHMSSLEERIQKIQNEYSYKHAIKMKTVDHLYGVKFSGTTPTRGDGSSDSDQDVVQYYPSQLLVLPSRIASKKGSEKKSSGQAATPESTPTKSEKKEKKERKEKDIDPGNVPQTTSVAPRELLEAKPIPKDPLPEVEQGANTSLEVGSVVIVTQLDSEHFGKAASVAHVAKSKVELIGSHFHTAYLGKLSEIIKDFKDLSVVSCDMGIDEETILAVFDSVLESSSSVDIGLNFISQEQHSHSPTMVKNTSSELGVPKWMISSNAISILAAYKTQFSDIVQHLTRSSAKQNIFIASKDKIASITAFKNSLGERGPVVSWNTDILSSKQVAEIEDMMRSHHRKHRPDDNYWGSFPRTSLISKGDPLENLFTKIEDYRAGDQVAIVASEDYPFGVYGIVITVFRNKGTVEILLEKEFKNGTSLSGRCSMGYGCTATPDSLLNLSALRRQVKVDPSQPKALTGHSKSNSVASNAAQERRNEEPTRIAESKISVPDFSKITASQGPSPSLGALAPPSITKQEVITPAKKTTNTTIESSSAATSTQSSSSQKPVIMTPNELVMSLKKATPFTATPNYTIPSNVTCSPLEKKASPQLTNVPEIHQQATTSTTTPTPQPVQESFAKEIVPEYSSQPNLPYPVAAFNPPNQVNLQQSTSMPTYSIFPTTTNISSTIFAAPTQESAPYPFSSVSNAPAIQDEKPSATESSKPASITPLQFSSSSSQGYFTPTPSFQPVEAPKGQPQQFKKSDSFTTAPAMKVGTRQDAKEKPVLLKAGSGANIAAIIPPARRFNKLITPSDLMKPLGEEFFEPASTPSQPNFSAPVNTTPLSAPSKCVLHR